MYRVIKLVGTSRRVLAQGERVGVWGKWEGFLGTLLKVNVANHRSKKKKD